MPAPYSTDLREKVLAALDAGVGTQAEVAVIFGIGVATVRRWAARQRRGELPATHPGPRPGSRSYNAEALAQLRALVAARPDGSYQDYTDWMAEEHGLVTSRASTGRALRQLGLTRKKRRTTLRNG